MDYHSLLTITHDMGRGISIGSYTLRFYQLMFLASFIGGFYIVSWMFKREKAPIVWMDSLLTYMVVATVLGARLGHVFFYQWDYYSENLVEIFQVWKGGLASHGAAIGIVAALILFSRKVTKRSPFWILDRVVVVVALAAVFIRVGNYTNSEIYGNIANSSVETVFVVPPADYLENVYPEYIYDVEFVDKHEVFKTDSIQYPIYQARVFVQDGINLTDFGRKLELDILPRMTRRKQDDLNIISMPNASYTIDSKESGLVTINVLGVPRYPTQWIEALAYLFSFIVLFLVYYKTDKKDHQGFLFGLFLVFIFGFRFFVEMLKANQVDFEQAMTYNMGQLLSIPLVLIGLVIMLTANKRIKDYKPNK